jgi:FtsP/CotA-like multicopper oxidase with cupredoxin domain
LINAAASTQFWIDLGALIGTVVAADGHPVRPVRATRLPLAMAQRLGIDRPSCQRTLSIFAHVEGKRARTGSSLPHPARPCHVASEAEENKSPVVSRSNAASKRSSRWRGVARRDAP